MDWTALGVSLRLGIGTVVLLVPCALALGHLLAFGRFRGRFHPQMILGALCDLDDIARAALERRDIDPFSVDQNRIVTNDLARLGLDKRAARDKNGAPAESAAQSG